MTLTEPILAVLCPHDTGTGTMYMDTWIHQLEKTNAYMTFCIYKWGLSSNR
jgi:1,6-anhydro-N-acetylmuramate kinase